MRRSFFMLYSFVSAPAAQVKPAYTVYGNMHRSCFSSNLFSLRSPVYHFGGGEIKGISGEGPGRVVMENTS